ncbi:5-oxoprolinase subunit PxpA [Thaumasiovibrio sp. DFM-14]|uniref:5-oxoprolinase subunit PxpA n=1 Tax=Thaumasiovibrio sp. DFM-14 TaxID=3384792 RepID=UPI0039A2F4DC
MLINSDVGESYGAWTMGNDIALFPYLDMANIACGFHASDPLIMMNTLNLAAQHHVKVGAHPGYNDKLGFGRRPIKHSHDEIRALIAYQVGALKSLAALSGVRVSYIKPHGALYNSMMADRELFEVIAETAGQLALPLMVLSCPQHEQLSNIAAKYHTTLIFEVFIDRHYDSKGYLLPRHHPSALINHYKDIQQRIQTLAQGYIEPIEGERLYIPIDSACVHGDNLAAIAQIAKIRQWIDTYS